MKHFHLCFTDDSDSESVFVMLNGEESELVFTYCTNIKVLNTVIILVPDNVKYIYIYSSGSYSQFSARFIF